MIFLDDFMIFLDDDLFIK